MKEILENADDFIEIAEHSMKKEKWNVAVANYFRAIANVCDYLIYEKMSLLPKNHNERFDILKKQLNQIYTKVFDLFILYRESYNLKLTMEDALKVQKTCDELRRSAQNKS